MIGLYSPLSRCGQTALGIKICEELSRNGKTIFLNFDNYSPLPMLFGNEAEGDITDILYYSECERSRFCIYLEKIKQSIGGYDYIPPAATSMQIKEIDYEKLKNLVELILSECGYEYVVLDLSDLPEGLFDILRYCDKVFTIIGKAMADVYKLRRFEDVLGQNGYEDLCASTVKISLPEDADDKELSAYAGKLLLAEALIGG
mgnify:CR=1 FL=1